MGVEKERLSGNFFLPEWVAVEHAARYHFASQFVNGKTVVDCACGNGEGTQQFAERAKAVYGFDVAEEALAEARKKCPNNNVEFKLASGTALPIPDDYADVYISLETIEHINEDEAFLKEASRVLKKGGIFICSTPNRLITNPGKSLASKPANIFHVREYNEMEFTALLKKYFSKIEIQGQNPNVKLKADALGYLGKFLPMHLAVRIHQFDKLASHRFRSGSYYSVQPGKKGFECEYLTAVCTK